MLQIPSIRIRARVTDPSFVLHGLGVIVMSILVLFGHNVGIVQSGEEYTCTNGDWQWIAGFGDREKKRYDVTYY